MDGVKKRRVCISKPRLQLFCRMSLVLARHRLISPSLKLSHMSRLPGCLLTLLFLTTLWNGSAMLVDKVCQTGLLYAVAVLTAFPMGWLILKVKVRYVT